MVEFFTLEFRFLWIIPLLRTKLLQFQFKDPQFPPVNKSLLLYQILFIPWQETWEECTILSQFFWQTTSLFCLARTTQMGWMKIYWEKVWVLWPLIFWMEDLEGKAQILPQISENKHPEQVSKLLVSFQDHLSFFASKLFRIRTSPIFVYHTMLLSRFLPSHLGKLLEDFIDLLSFTYEYNKHFVHLFLWFSFPVFYGKYVQSMCWFHFVCCTEFGLDILRASQEESVRGTTPVAEIHKMSLPSKSGYTTTRTGTFLFDSIFNSFSFLLTFHFWHLVMSQV